MLRIISPIQSNQFFSHPFSNIRNSNKNLKKDAPRVLILYSGILLDNMIAILFGDEPNLEILINGLDKEELIAQQIVSEKPQTVILCQSIWFSVEKLNHILEDLHYSEAVQIVAVSLTENSLEIINKKKVITTNFKSFIHLVKPMSFSFNDHAGHLFGLIFHPGGNIG